MGAIEQGMSFDPNRSSQGKPRSRMRRGGKETYGVDGLIFGGKKKKDQQFFHFSCSLRLPFLSPPVSFLLRSFSYSARELGGWSHHLCVTLSVFSFVFRSAPVSCHRRIIGLEKKKKRKWSRASRKLEGNEGRSAKRISAMHTRDN